MYSGDTTMLGMAADDAQRIWFPEMIGQLRARWREDMPVDNLVELRDQLDAMLQQVRTERRLVSPTVRCRRCGRVGEGAAPHVSVRAMILALLRFGIAPAEQTYTLEKSWTVHRREKDLDLYGRVGAAEPNRVGCCVRD